MSRATLAAIALTLGCRATSAPALPSTAKAAPSPSLEATYEVTIAEGASSLCVVATMPLRALAQLGFEDGGERFVTGLTKSETGARYCFDVARAARELDDPASVEVRGDAFLAAPSAWLAHPDDPPEGVVFHLRVKAPPGTQFVTGFPSDGRGGFQATLADLLRAPYAAMGRFDVRTVDRPSFHVEVALLDAKYACGTPSILDWIASSADVVSTFYRGAPLPNALIIIAPESGSGIGYARTMGNGGASILAPIGTSMSSSELAASWPMVHEMLHVAFPNMPIEQRWLEEGMATYVEPIARARVSAITPEQAFERFVRRMPFGLPGPGDRGLDATPTWGRTYWGGALFCLMADVAIRERTNGARSLDDALIAMLKQGGNVATRWDMSDVIASADRATGTTVIAELYEQYGKRATTTDLAALFAKLGVREKSGVVTFDESAPLASIRRAIVSAR